MDDQVDRSILGATSAGILRVTLLFGSAAVAMTCRVSARACSERARKWRNSSDKHARDRMFASVSSPGVDFISTGSVRSMGAGESYTIRRSVLQSDPHAECIIRSNGARSGSC